MEERVLYADAEGIDLQERATGILYFPLTVPSMALIAVFFTLFPGLSLFQDACKPVADIMHVKAGRRPTRPSPTAGQLHPLDGIGVVGFSYMLYTHTPHTIIRFVSPACFPCPTIHGTRDASLKCPVLRLLCKRLHGRPCSYSVGHQVKQASQTSHSS